MANTMEEAANATMDMFNNQEPVQEPTQETPVEEPAQEQVDPITEQAVNTAEVAAQAAQQRELQNQQLLQENDQLKQQVQQLSDSITELSKQQEEEILEDSIPHIDFASMMYDDEDVIRQKEADFAKQMSDHVRAQIMNEPWVEQAKKGYAQSQKDEALQMLSNIPQFSDIVDRKEQVNNVIENSGLGNMDIPTDQKYMLAYLIANGVDSINNPKKDPTSDELMAFYESNPEFQEAIEKRRIGEVKNSQQVPPFSASSGAVNAALDFEEKPKTLEEAKERAKKLFK